MTDMNIEESPEVHAHRLKLWNDVVDAEEAYIKTDGDPPPGWGAASGKVGDKE